MGIFGSKPKENENDPEIPEQTDEEIEKENAKEEKKKRWRKILWIAFWVIFHTLALAYLIWCTVTYILYDRDRKCQEPPPRDPNSNETQPTKPLQCDFDWCHGYGFLIILYALFYIFYFYYVVIKPTIGKPIYERALLPVHDKWMEFSRRRLVSIILLCVILLVVITVVVVESRDDWLKMVGLVGPIVFIAVGFLISKHRREIKWRIIVHGLLMQFILGLVCIRWKFGRGIFDCVGQKATRFLGFTYGGALFVYGQKIMDDFVFAFAILAVIFFFSVVVSILYYFGVMQAVLIRLGWILQTTVGTTVCESVNAAGNIVLGMTECPLMIRPYLPILTASEIHAVMVAGFATVAGTVLGAYISFGASAAYLITASVMAAPASLAFAKLIYPETEESHTTSDTIKMEKSESSSVLDAAVMGATNGIMIVLGIVANIIAFIAILDFLNAIVKWIFELGGVEDVTLTLIFTYIFIPIAFIMGVPWNDCYKVAAVIAKKSILNEFVGYMELGRLIKDKKIDFRSESIATFALCGFANPGSLGILVAALYIMAPQRHEVITKVAYRALIAGSIVSFTSASWAGILTHKFD